MNVAYIVNKYPEVSHTFIRREIRALEALGVKVARFSIRPTAPARLPDSDDREECARTRAILSVGILGLAMACLRALCVGPGRWCDGLRMAWRLGRRSDRGLLLGLLGFFWHAELMPTERWRCRSR
jgi:hypothetical protein